MTQTVIDEVQKLVMVGNDNFHIADFLQRCEEGQEK